MESSPNEQVHKVAVYALLLTGYIFKSVHTLCPSGSWTEWSGACYFLSGDSLSFTDAQSACIHRGATLATVLNPYENNFVKDLCSKQAGCNGDWELWLGLYRSEPCHGCSLNERRMHWTWMPSKQPLVWANWHDRSIGKSEPTGPEQCARMWMDGGTWGSKTCDSRIGYVCKTGIVTTTVKTPAPSTSKSTAPAAPTTQEVVTTAVTTPENDSVSVESLPQVGDKSEGLSVGGTAGLIIGGLVCLGLAAVFVVLFVRRYRKIYYRKQLDQGVYCTTMEDPQKPPASNYCITVHMDHTTPHYDDDALNLYETIPLGEEAEGDNCKNAELEGLSEGACGGITSDAKGKCSNDYVEPVKYSR